MRAPRVAQRPFLHPIRTIHSNDPFERLWQSSSPALCRGEAVDDPSVLDGEWLSHVVSLLPNALLSLTGPLAYCFRASP